MSTSTGSGNERDMAEEMLTTNRLLCFHKKDSNACFALGNFYSQFEKREDKAAKLYQHACDNYNHGNSCFYLGNFFFVARGDLRKDTKKFLEYSKKGCQYGSAGACMLLAAYFHPKRTKIPFMDKDDLKVKDFSKSVDYYDKACQLNNPGGCVQAGTAYLYGEEDAKIDKNEAKALPFFIKGCDNGESEACGYASWQYKNGVGAPADPKLAELFLAKFKNIEQEKKTQRK